MVFCHDCGTKNNDTSQFCGNCGTKLHTGLVDKPSENTKSEFTPNQTRTQGPSNPSYQRQSGKMRQSNQQKSSKPSYTDYTEQPAKSNQNTQQGPSSSYSEQTATGQNNATYQEPQSSYSQQTGSRYGGKPPKTILLSIVIILNWIGVILLGLATILLLFVFFPIGIVVGLITAVQYWITNGLSNYKNNARIVVLVLSGISLFGNLSTLLSGGGFPLIGIIIGGLIIYTLAFHDETVQLFKLNPKNISRQERQTWGSK